MPLKTRAAASPIPRNPWRLPETLALALWLVVVTYVSAHHEPWADEAQAWSLMVCGTRAHLLYGIPSCGWYHGCISRSTLSGG